ncbi:MAG TPA: ATP-binding protein [Chloroflexota bacterium]
MQWILLSVACVLIAVVILALALTTAAQGPRFGLAQWVQLVAGGGLLLDAGLFLILRRIASQNRVDGVDRRPSPERLAATATTLEEREEREAALANVGLEESPSTIYRPLTALAEEEARQRALVNALQEPLLTTDSDGRIRGWNVAATRLAARFFSEDVQSLRGRRIQELLPFLASENLEGPWQGHLSTGDGDAMDVQVTQAALPEGSLPITHVYVLHDVSQQVELSRLRERLLLHVAHELRGPVTVLDNALDLLEDAGDEAKDLILPMARRNARQMIHLMGNLLSAANIQAGRFVVNPSTIDLGVVLKEALDTLGDSLKARAQTITHNLGDLKYPVVADAAYLQMVLLNLVNNASKYSPEGTNIEIDVHMLDGQVRVQVKDSGHGVPPEEQARIFESFYRLSRDFPEPGLGLGLAIVKEIVVAHGGTVGLESEQGKGTTFWFTLPVPAEDATTPYQQGESG